MPVQTKVKKPVVRIPREPTPTCKYAYVKDMLKLYKRAWRIVKRGGTIAMSWAGPNLNEAGFREEFITALNKRINLKAGIIFKGRKHDELYQIELHRDAANLVRMNNERLRVYKFGSPEANQRFRHKLARYDD